MGESATVSDSLRQYRVQPGIGHLYLEGVEQFDGIILPPQMCPFGHITFPTCSDPQKVTLRDYFLLGQWRSSKGRVSRPFLFIPNDISFVCREGLVMVDSDTQRPCLVE